MFEEGSGGGVGAIPGNAPPGPHHPRAPPQGCDSSSLRGMQNVNLHFPRRKVIRSQYTGTVVQGASPSSAPPQETNLKRFSQTLDR